MKRLRATTESTFGHEITVRIHRPLWNSLTDYMRQGNGDEQIAFGLASLTHTRAGTIFQLDEQIIPSREDLSEQSVTGVCPSRSVQGVVYLLAEQKGKAIVEFHTHPGPARPTFSKIDEHFGVRNARCIAERFAEPTTLVMVVGNNRFDMFDGVVYDRQLKQFCQLARLEALGRPTTLWSFDQPSASSKESRTAQFDRQQRIPGWNQCGLEQQRIGILGAGGNGAPLLQTLVSIGAGRRGFIAIVDDDLIELSNLPRIPYASLQDVGTAKVNVALQYAHQKSPDTPLFPFQARFSDPQVRQQLKMATILFYCGDNDGGRKEANDLAVRYGIPLIDLGCDVQVADDTVLAGGQVRVVIPGETACLVCCRGYDPAQAAIDQMSDADRALHAAAGYVRGADANATASVANLNGLTVQFAVSQFLAMVNGPEFAQWDYLHFDQFTGRTIPARTSQDPNCPLCGLDGNLMAGDRQSLVGSDQTVIGPWSADTATDGTDRSAAGPLAFLRKFRRIGR